jgi:hypothetical protein
MRLQKKYFYSPRIKSDTPNEQDHVHSAFSTAPASVEGLASSNLRLFDYWLREKINARANESVEKVTLRTARSSVYRL